MSLNDALLRFISRIDFLAGTIKVEDTERCKEEILRNQNVVEKVYNKILIENRTLFYIPFQITVDFRNRETIHYTIKSTYLFPVLVVFILFSAFASQFNISQFLLFALIVSLLFIGANIIHIRSILRNLIQLKDEKENDREFTVEEQNKWLIDPSKCPACGNDVSPYEWVCSDCGLRISEKKRFSRFNHTGTHRKMTYLYKER